MVRNVLITAVVSAVMGLFALMYTSVAPPDRRAMPSDRTTGAQGRTIGSQPAESMAFDQGLMLFRQQVRPVLTGICLKCHDSTKRSGGLDLSRRETALAGGETGEAIVPGEPDESLLIQLVTAGEMPKEGALLGKEEIEALKRWIESGAPYEDEPLSYTAGALGAVSAASAGMNASRPDAAAMTGSSPAGMNNMMMCPCMQMMQQMMAGSGSGMMGQNGTSGQAASPARPFSNPRTKEQARQRAEEHLQSAGNPNLKVGQVNETVASYEIEVVTQDGSLVNWIIIDKQSGQLRTLY